MWLLLTASYGLIIKNTKWQRQSNKCYFNHEFIQCKQVSQICYELQNGEVVPVMTKITDDIEKTGTEDNAYELNEKLGLKFKVRNCCEWWLW